MFAKSKSFNATQLRDLDRIESVVEQMLKDGEALLQRPLLLQRLWENGLSHHNWAGLAPYQEWYNVSLAGCMQIPTELVDFLLYTART